MVLIESFEYDYELYRVNAFCICNNKLYENSQHFECMLDILEERGYNRDKCFHEGDKTMEQEINSNIVMGEIAIIDNNKYVMIYDICNTDVAKKHYNNMDILLNKYDDLYII